LSICTASAVFQGSACGHVKESSAGECDLICVPCGVLAGAVCSLPPACEMDMLLTAGERI